MLREGISRELDFKDGISNGMADAILDRIEVQKTGQRDTGQFHVYLKTKEEPMAFLVKRKRGGRSEVLELLQ